MSAKAPLAIALLVGGIIGVAAGILYSRHLEGDSLAFVGALLGALLAVLSTEALGYNRQHRDERILRESLNRLIESLKTNAEFVVEYINGRNRAVPEPVARASASILRSTAEGLMELLRDPLVGERAGCGGATIELWDLRLSLANLVHPFADRAWPAELASADAAEVYDARALEAVIVNAGAVLVKMRRVSRLR